MYLLYRMLGTSAIIGSMVCIIIMLPLQFVIGKKMSSNAEMCAVRSFSNYDILPARAQKEKHKYPPLIKLHKFRIPTLHTDEYGRSLAACDRISEWHESD